MNPDQAQALGDYLRQARSDHGWSARQLSEQAGIAHSNVVRLENGSIPSPTAETLAKLAEALEVPLEDVYALAGFSVPDQLPNLQPYLRTKYRDLPASEIERIQAFAADIAAKHGISLDGPRPGEDEDTT